MLVKERDERDVQSNYDPDNLDDLDDFSESDLSSSQYSPSEFSSSNSLSPTRFYLRSLLLPIVERESHVISRLQRRFRTPFWDKYFVYTSSLGTHTFFMILLPAMFFFGFRDMGMGLVMVMGGGVYASSIVKDLVCSPRPLAPPVTRLTIGNHHLEYGFPSTHSTNSVSIALFFWGYVHTFFYDDSVVYWTCTVILLIYTLSIVLGRIYTAMHSFIDCIFGVLLGASVWWCVTDLNIGGYLTGFGFSARLQAWISDAVSGSAANSSAAASSLSLSFSSTLSAITCSPISPPLLLTTFFLLLVNQHPQPIDDCPCFEDAIASGAVVFGALLGRWATAYFHLHDLIERLGGPKPMLGAGWNIVNIHNENENVWVPIDRGFKDYTLFTVVAFAKILLGVTFIFIWRLFAKSLLGLLLPPLFRLVARVVGAARVKLGMRWLGMPNRRFYLPATEYRGPVPNGFIGIEEGEVEGDEYELGRRMGSIPSVIDLPSTLTVGVEIQGGIGSGFARDSHRNGNVGREIKSRAGNGSSKLSNEVNAEEDIAYTPDGNEDKFGSGSGMRKHIHYDADVLTKILVYAGIAILSIEVTPLVFELLGWGVYVSPPEGVLVHSVQVA
ncbi:sphingosine-1-phosphate phosphatase [Lentinula lateritia]|uniref:Sphingosine-1-phosphate phosphatase n=1 Tax=Lentinula aff. lateritia TaxID=2804960 RepID=A0ACC1U8J8_9AGAR|nr:sphingosine-1-phosphate phosphatase [Lentinula aff. lateritia]KAJ3853279.1 sphingosine-1-phosphate phosphatase [Lentinula lateritia]